MEGQLGILIMICILFILFLKEQNNLKCINNIEKFMPVPNTNILGPSIIGNMTTDNMNYNYININNIDPYNNTEINSRNIMKSNEHNMINNFKEYTTKKSLAYACIKQILYDTKIKLNENNTPIQFNTTNIKEINTNTNFKIIINKIINSIITYANSSFYIKYTDNNEIFKVFKEINNNKYFINYENDIYIIHPYDDIYEKNKIFNNSYKDLFFNDVLTSKNPMVLKLMIQFTIIYKQNNLNCNNNEECNLRLKNNMDIYINNISTFKPEK